LGTSLRLLTFRGIEIKVHWSFVLILIWGAVAYSVVSSNPMQGAIYGVVVILLLFLCVTLHELGHAIAAHAYDIKVPTITLLPIGGVASLERMPEKPQQELVIALAGPAVNIVLLLILAPLAWIAASVTGAAGAGLNPFGWLGLSYNMGVANLIYYLAAVNLLLAIFNLLPAFPMDGGRVLRALLAMRMPYVRATRTAVFIGRLVAIPLAIWGIVSGNILMLLIAFFVYVGGGAEREAVESKSVLRTIHARDALTHDLQRLYTSEQLSRAVTLVMSSYQADYPVFDLGNRYVGILTRARLVDSLRTLGQNARVVEAMLPAADVPVANPADTLAEVWETMGRSGSRVVVVMEHGNFLGLVSLDDLTEIIHVMGAALERDAARPPGDAGDPDQPGMSRDQPAPPERA
jgi:stage IV sporulation protein FB